MRRILRVAIGLAAVCAVSPGMAQDAATEALRSELESERRTLVAQQQVLAQQQRALEAQAVRLQALEDQLLLRMRARGAPGQSAAAAQPAAAPARAPAVATQGPAKGQAPQGAAAAGPVPARGGPAGEARAAADVQPVGEAPEPEPLRDVAVLGDQGGIITKRNRLTVEAGFEYGRADRNRFVFRGVQVPPSVFIGAFDINESRQDILVGSVTGRYGLTNRLETSLRIPLVYRSDSSVTVPIVNPNPQAPGPQQTVEAEGAGLGDIEVSVRYQVTDGQGGSPYLVAGLQLVAPTGESPFDVPRDELNRATRAATGAGFWGLSPTVTILLPNDPAVIFGSLGYTLNFAETINQQFSDDTFLERVDPGDSISGSFGIGVSLNQRTSISFAYAHNWAFGTRTTAVQSLLNPGTGETEFITRSDVSRDLQIGRFLFGISYRTNRSTTINWSVEIGATDDATDVRTSLRVPFAFDF